MAPLARLREERDRMSAIERRIADFIMENAHFLRDYSSQQLANALGISQSSVVKFCQKLGFKGYPDLKFSVGEEIARAHNAPPAAAFADEPPPASTRRTDGLWRRKSQAQEKTRWLNPPETLDAVADAVAGAGTVYLCGLGEDAIHARGFALQLSLLGMRAIYAADAMHMAASIAAAEANDVLLVFSEHGRQSLLCRICRDFRAHSGKVVSITRHSANPVRACADIALVASAHDELPYLASMLYQTCAQHLLDGVLVRLCQNDESLQAKWQRNRAGAHNPQES